MYIEDLLQLVTGTGRYLFVFPSAIVTGNDYKILESISNQLIYHNTSLTEKQANLVVKLLKKNQDSIRPHVPTIDNDLKTPLWKLPFRTIPTVKKISIEKVEGTKCISVEFPYTQEIVESFRSRNKEMHDLYRGAWNNESKKWIFPLTEKTIEYLGDTLLNLEFQADEEFLSYYNSIKELLSKIEDHLPILIQTGEGFGIKNAHPKIPQPETNNLSEVLFWARTFGITHWSDEIESRIQSELNPVTKVILSANNKKHLWVDNTVHSINVFDDLITYSGSVLVIIPGGSELDSLKTWHDFAIQKGIDPEQISVMFRLPNEQSDFNQYVKHSNLNNPVSENTRLVFVSTKITKPLIKSGVKFNTVINLGYYNYMHFSMNTMVDNVQNLVYYSMKEPTFNNRWQPHEL